jgi:transcription elongation factor SPT6
MGVQWLLIHKGEDEKLFKVIVKLPEDVKKLLIPGTRENNLSH